MACLATLVMMGNDYERGTLWARSRDGDENRDGGGGIVTERRTKEQAKTKKPPLYKCILLNDDYTPMEFVVEILKQIFFNSTPKPPE